MRFTIPVPPSTNNLFATYGQRRVTTEKYMRWQKEADALVMIQRSRQERIAPPVQVTISVPQSNRRRDLGNYEKAVGDCLVRCGILPDDSDLIIKRIVIQVAPQLECTVDVEPFTAGPRVEAIPHEGRV